MQSEEIRKRFIEFFKKRGHTVIPSAPLVPENDPTVLFNTAGMQPLVPYLMGTPHPAGRRLVNVQKCVRTQDIDEVGDNTHDTFFEMLGNWSLGDYFKDDAIKWSYEFITSPHEGLGLSVDRLYVTVFAGDEFAPRDEESAMFWLSLGVPKERIYFLGAGDNWWPARKGEWKWTGPTGTCTEMFYDTTEEGLGNLTTEEFVKATDDQKIVEFWNDVFMQYEAEDGKLVGALKCKNVDTGAGLERLAMVLQKKQNIFETDLFSPLMSEISHSSKAEDTRAARIVADHIRTSVFMISDGVVPSNTDQGYILRRLLRRAVRYADILQSDSGILSRLVPLVITKYQEIYPNLSIQESHIQTVISEEEMKFRKTLEKGLKEFEKIKEVGIGGEEAFQLFSTYGFPIDLTEELAKEAGVSIDRVTFDQEFKKHQELSRSGAEKKFKGGLADHSDMSVRYHTATHMLQQALRTVLGTHVFQKGSNITPERLRFDFSHTDKMTPEQIKATEDLVNQKIKEALPVTYEDISLEEAEKRGAIGLFEEKYGDKVRVYQIGEGDKKYSLEFCGGPHVTNTNELGGSFKIVKEEAVAQGIRRIKAVIE